MALLGLYLAHVAIAYFGAKEAIVVIGGYRKLNGGIDS